MPPEVEPAVATVPQKDSAPTRVTRRRRVAAAGKALLVWLGTGSIGAAIVAYIIFKLMGC